MKGPAFAGLFAIRIFFVKMFQIIHGNIDFSLVFMIWTKLEFCSVLFHPTGGVKK